MENSLNSNFSRNLSLSRPLIAVDWGTTSLRAAFITNEQVVEERSSEQGIMSVPPGEFPSVLSQICAQWLDNEDVLILISGMAGSAQGWQLAPYCPCPVTPKQLAHQLHWINPNKIAIVPGLSIRLEHAPDVIRGEEVQVIGALSLLGNQNARLVLPGTHSKWVDVKEGRFESFSTFMTGEFFSILREHSILSKTLPSLLEETEFDEAAFNEGLELSLASQKSKTSKTSNLKSSGKVKTTYKPNLLHDVFGIRTLALFEEQTAAQLLNKLSGLLIGYELQTQQFKKKEEVIIVGAPALQRCYSHALSSRGVKAIALGSEATWRGFQVIAKELEKITQN